MITLSDSSMPLIGRYFIIIINFFFLSFCIRSNALLLLVLCLYGPQISQSKSVHFVSEITTTSRSIMTRRISSITFKCTLVKLFHGFVTFTSRDSMGACVRLRMKRSILPSYKCCSFRLRNVIFRCFSFCNTRVYA